MRQSTLETLGLGSVLGIFERGALPAATSELVDRVFGSAGNRGALVISGANGIVGAGKTMQLGSRLEPYGVTVVALDFPGAPDGIGKQYPGLVRAFGERQAADVMANVARLAYDGAHLPKQLAAYRPRFLLEAIPEILEIKKSHYEVFRTAYPAIEIRSVTSGFPRHQLGVGITHPAFPHEVNKVWEVVEPEPSAITQLYWALGLLPLPVSDHWSFVLDVLFCGLTLAAIRYHEATNMPFWKIDKYVRKLIGPNPFRAHDAIGAKGANFLTWSCLHHLAQHYGDLFKPASSLVERKDSGQDWYPMNHFRPLVNWTVDGEEIEELRAWVAGALFQMTSLMVQERRSHLTHINAIGELCAQFRPGVLAQVRGCGSEAAIKLVENYHRLHPDAAKQAWHAEALRQVGSPEWQQLYVNAEHDGNVGVISISRESYSRDVDLELNRAIDWLRSERIDRVILTGDFHLSTQMVGADIADFFPALADAAKGVEIARSWSTTARRLHNEFSTSVGFVNGKRCLGGFLELLTHCHYVVAVDNADLGMPEVTLPVVPGMEGCHWLLRKAQPEHWQKILGLLLGGRPVKGRDAVGWLVDYAGSLDDAIKTAWSIARGEASIRKRPVEEGRLEKVPIEVSGLPAPSSPTAEAARRAILDNIQGSCAVALADALAVQSKHSGDFMTSSHCRGGTIGGTYSKTMEV
ncbi:MAG: hypothetical protein AB1714_30115 [Acidobacteriota bacterium]